MILYLRMDITHIVVDLLLQKIHIHTKLKNMNVGYDTWSCGWIYACNDAAHYEHGYWL